MATDDDDAATLRERVRELEQTVAQQQDTIEQLLPSRRAILAGGAGLVGGAALTGQASAQSAAGQIGTSSEPVDVEAASVNVQEGVSTPSAFVSGTLTASDVNTDSVNTDKAVFNNTTVNVQSFTIADDDAVSFSAGSLKEVKVITDAGNFNGAWGADFGDLYEIWTAQATSTGSGSLSGTTGTDGQMTVSRDGNAVLIENRSGGQLSADIIKFER